MTVDETLWKVSQHIAQIRTEFLREERKQREYVKQQHPDTYPLFYDTTLERETV